MSGKGVSTTLFGIVVNGGGDDENDGEEECCCSLALVPRMAGVGVTGRV